MREQKYGLTFVISAQIARVRFKLTAVNDGLTRLVDVDTPQGYFRTGPDGGLPEFTLPTDLRMGLYTLTLQHVLTDQRVVEGELYERLTDVQ